LIARFASAIWPPVVKADAYGLGARQIAAALIDSGYRHFFVALLEKAIDLRAALAPETTIYVLSGLKADAEVHYARCNLETVQNTFEQCRLWAEQGGRPAVLQVDSGMSRLGLSVEKQNALAADAELLVTLNLTLIMSHLANAAMPNHRSSQQKFQAPNLAMTRFPRSPASLAKSAGIVLSSGYHFDLCHPGAAPYGLEAVPRVNGLARSPGSQFGSHKSAASRPTPALAMDMILPRPMRIATIAVGYADGWPRALFSRAAAWVDGQSDPGQCFDG